MERKNQRKSSPKGKKKVPKSGKEYLRRALKETEPPLKIEETIELCRAMVREYPPLQEERTGFFTYLSDVFRYEGMSVFGLQALALLTACLGISFDTRELSRIPFFALMFTLAMMPVLFRGQMHGMSEIEAATRASGAQIMLAKLVLAGAANLVCMTVFLCMALRLENAAKQIGQLILYILVPYLSCMAFMLQRIRLCGRTGCWQSMAAGFLSCLFWGVSARLCPWLYGLSAGSVWAIGFLVFGGFFVKEIWFLWEMRKEGKMYGTVA